MQGMEVLSGVVFLIAISFFAWYRIAGASAFRQWITRTFGEKAAVYAVLIPRWLGALLFGVIPFFLMQSFFPDYFDARLLQIAKAARTFWWTAGLLALIFPVMWITSQKAAHLAQYPQIRYPQWTPGILVASALSWIAYLFAYEFLFRGLLWSVSLGVLDLSWAIALNIALYALVHWPKGRVEVLASIPFGLVILWATIDTGNLWVAVLAHCALALSDEWMSLYHHPDIHLKRQKT